MKSFILVTLALATLFSVAKGDDSIILNTKFSDNEFINKATNKFAQSITLTDGGKTTTYTLMNVKGGLNIDGVDIPITTTRLIGVLLADDGRYAIFNSTRDLYAYSFVTGVRDGKRNLYLSLYSYSAFNYSAYDGTSYTSDDGKKFVVEVSTDFKNVSSIVLESGSVPILGTYGDSVYFIGTGINTVNGHSVCGDDTNCFVYNIFGDNPKYVLTPYVQTSSTYYTIKSDSDDTAIVVVKSDFGANNISLYVFKKADGEFSLYANNVIGTSPTGVSGEYKDGKLYLFVKASTLSILGEGYSSTTDAVFMTTDFSTAKWFHPVPISVYSRYYFFSSVSVYDSESILLTVTHSTGYGDYNGTEIFLRGTSDVAVVLLNSATGAMRDIKTFGKANKMSYVCNSYINPDTKKILLNTLIEDYNTGLVNPAATEVDVYICNNGINKNKKCLCDEGYVGEKCNIKCPVDNEGKICGGNGACYLNDNGDAAACACKNGYVGEKCTEKCTTNDNGDICGGDGVCYLNNNGNAACLSFPTYASGSGSTIICPECKCNNSDNSGSNKCNENGVTGVRPLFLLIGLIVLFML